MNQSSASDRNSGAAPASRGLIKCLTGALAPYLHILYYVLTFILIYALTRLLGVVIYCDVIDFNEVPRLFLNGLRTDISGLGYLMALPVLLTFLRSALPLRAGKPFFYLEKGWLFLTGLLVFFLELCTFPFMEEYSVRPNRLFVEYLVYPEELIKLMLRGHLTAVVAVTALMTAFTVFLYRALGRIRQTRSPSVLAAVLVFILLGGLDFIAARSSFEHRPFNLAKASFSTSQIVNNLAANSGYSLITSVKAALSENQNTYQTMEPRDILALIKEDTRFNYAPATEEHPTLNVFAPVNRERKLNIVIILEESLGAQFSKTLGGSDFTPELDRIYAEGWGFTRLYATGVRSVRGIEAVTSGFTPTINTAVVKREKSQKNFFNLGGLLRKQGYSTAFIYGGESHFDNMRSFFLGNGYDTIIDINSYDNPEFVASWGVSDEDLFNKAISHFDEEHQAGRLFYSLVFTSSNHDPYEIPDKFAKGAPRSRENAVRYADYALGRFYDTVKTKPYFKDTIFLVIADHDARAGGSELVPVKNFHIPGALFGAGIEKRSEDHVVSQIDIPKTLLSLAGIAAEVPLPGYDLANLPEDFQGRALLQFYQNFALLRDDGSLMMILPDAKSASRRYDFNDHSITEAPDNPALEKLALAYALLGELAYQKGYFLNCPGT